MLRLMEHLRQQPVIRQRTTPSRVARVVVAISGSLAIMACEQADRFAGGIDLDAAPPVIDGTLIVRATAPSDVPASGVGTRADSARPDADPTQPTAMVAATPPVPAASRPVAPPPMLGNAAPTATATQALPVASTIATAATAAGLDTARTPRPVRERSAALLSADRAFASRSGCSEAIRLYASVPRPSDINSPDGTDWVGAQLRTAQCSIELREWMRALDAIALVKASRPREWSAAYFEGHVYCQMGQFDRGTKAFRDLTSLLGTLGTGARQAVTLLSKYGTATCDRLDYEASRQPERNKDQLELFLGEYEEFLKGADRMQSTGGVPTDYAREVSSALKSARDNVTKYSKP